MFVVDTPFQLLNAIEAAKSLALANNHLVVIKYPGLNQSAFRPLIKTEDWVSVIFLSLEIDGKSKAPEFLCSPMVRKWHSRLLHLKQRRKFTRICKSFRQAGNLFLGHYWIQYKYYMRHFANNLNHEKLYLLDDGTDTMDINKRRKCIDLSLDPAHEHQSKPEGSILAKFKGYIRKRYWDWNLQEAESVTFFTTYGLEVRTGDHLVKNDYRYLKSLAINSTAINEVCFLGGCFFEDNFMKEEIYLEHLRKMKAYFEKEKIVYVPHPRQSAHMIETIASSLGFEIKQFGVPIEVAIVTGGYLPKVLASFTSSALESCVNILGQSLKIICFRIASEHLLKGRGEIAAVYEHFNNKVNLNFTIIPLEISQPDLTIPSRVVMS